MIAENAAPVIALLKCFTWTKIGRIGRASAIWIIESLSHGHITQTLRAPGFKLTHALSVGISSCLRHQSFSENLSADFFIVDISLSAAPMIQRWSSRVVATPNTVAMTREIKMYMLSTSSQ